MRPSRLLAYFVLLLSFALLACDAPAPGDDDATSSPTPPMPDPLKSYSGASCPTLSSGSISFRSDGRDRTVQVDLPNDPTGAGVLFLWHGNGDTVSNFASAMAASNMARNNHVIVVTPASCCGSVAAEWPFPPMGSPEPDLTLFDDMLTCLDEQYGIDRRRVYTSGFSAGALWSTYLVMQRSNYLAAATIFSGGTQQNVNPYTTPIHDTPVLLTHGGSQDTVVISFQAATLEFREALIADGHLVLLCPHEGGHTVPNGFRNWALPFLFQHDWGQPSPYEGGQDPTGALPDTCIWPE